MKTVVTIGLMIAALSLNLQALNVQAAETSAASWSGDYAAVVNGPAFKDGSSASINHYVGLNRSFNDDYSLSAVFQPNTQIMGEGDAFSMGDSYLKAGLPNAYKSDFLTVSTQLRYYAPISDASSASTHGKFQPRVYFSYKRGAFSFAHSIRPTIYLRTATSATDTQAALSVVPAGSYTVNNWLNLDLAAAPTAVKTKAAGISMNDIPVYPGMTAKITEKWSASPYLEVLALNPRASTTSVGVETVYSLF